MEVAALNSQGCRQMGHVASVCPRVHFWMHCRWNGWEQTPQLTELSSPGYFWSGAQPSNGERQMPQTSSPAPQVQEATACHFVILIFRAMLVQTNTMSRRQIRNEAFISCDEVDVRKNMQGFLKEYAVGRLRLGRKGSTTCEQMLPYRHKAQVHPPTCHQGCHSHPMLNCS